MENGILTQLYPVLIFIISGIIIGILFDIFRVFRRSFHTPDIITYIEDVLFWIISGLFLIFVIFNFTNGEIRIYNIIGLILGSVIYIICISKLFIKINVKIVLLMKKIFINIVKILMVPLQFIFKILQKIFKPFTFFVINIKNVLLNFKKTKNKKKNI